MVTENEKKAYSRPEMQVVKAEPVDVIAASPIEDGNEPSSPWFEMD